MIYASVAFYFKIYMDNISSNAQDLLTQQVTCDSLIIKEFKDACA